MSNWSSKPIVVLPLTVLVGFLAFLPFIAFGTEDAAKFYGAYFAAITGLAGVVVGAMVNAHLVRKRDDRLERIRVLAAARVARKELEDIKGILNTDVMLEGLPTNVDDETEIDSEHSTFGWLQWLEHYSPTPQLDAHLLALCQQSNKLADALLAFTKRRRIFLTTFAAVQGRRPGAPDSSYSVGFYAGVILLLRTDIDEAVGQLSHFASTHAGDFM